MKISVLLIVSYMLYSCTGNGLKVCNNEYQLLEGLMFRKTISYEDKKIIAEAYVSLDPSKYYNFHVYKLSGFDTNNITLLKPKNYVKCEILKRHNYRLDEHNKPFYYGITKNNSKTLYENNNIHLFEVPDGDLTIYLNKINKPDISFDHLPKCIFCFYRKKTDIYIFSIDQTFRAKKGDINSKEIEDILLMCERSINYWSICN
jgi:hypothetical protein